MSKDEADENQALSQTPPHIVHVHSGAFDTYSACLCRHQSSADSETVEKEESMTPPVDAS